MIRGSLQEKNGKWQVIAYVPGLNGKKQQVSRSTGISVKGGRKRDAEERRREILLELEREYATPGTNTGKIMFLDWINTWMEQAELDKRVCTIESYRGYINKHIEPYFKPFELTLKSVTPQHLQGFINKKCKELTPNTVKKYMAVIRGALKDATIKGLIADNPATRVTVPKSKKFEGKAYTYEQFDHLLSVAKGTPLERCIVLAGWYGLRRSEVLGLRWKDIDFKKETMSICNTRVKHTTEVAAEQTKSKASKRTLPLYEDTIPYFQRLKFEQQRDAVLNGWQVDDDTYICTWPNGIPYRTDYVSQGFEYLLKKNGLTPIRFHDLRHTACSLLLENGANPVQAQRFLGHENVETTLNVYTHLSKEGAKQTAQIMEKLIKRREA